MAGKRKVIIHYHIFKNAGTSVDEMLKESLGERWAERESPHQSGKVSPAEMETFILDNPDLLAVSSHQLVPPLPDRHLVVYPIVFLRHPIDRAYSAYLFEWKKQPGSDAPMGSFEDYVAHKFEQPRRNAIEDFQTLHLANRGYEARSPSLNLDDEELLRNAKSLLLSIPFFGVVEDYKASMEAMKASFGSVFPELTFKEFHANVLQDNGKTLYDKIKSLRQSVEKETFTQLVLRNQMDLRLFEFASACLLMRRPNAARPGIA